MVKKVWKPLIQHKANTYGSVPKDKTEKNY